jgi:serine/threonine protein kinase
MATGSKTCVTAFNSYTIKRKIGEGGSGRVFEATDSDRALVAIKTLDHRHLTSERLRRFKNEIHFCLNNQHKNLITVLDYGVTKVSGKECPFYVMPMYRETLRTLLEGKIDPSKVMDLFLQMLDGVEAAHLQSVWHRDLKPENVLYDRESDTLVIADFGIAHFVKELLYTLVETRPNARLANFQYAAREQRKPGLPVDHRSDIYALGLMLNEMFTGEVIQGTSFKTISSVSTQRGYLDELVEGMVRQSPDDRFKSIDSIKQVLTALGNQAASRQKLSELENKVIPRLEVNDPLVTNPVRVTKIDYQSQHLVFTLSGELTLEWKEVFSKLPSRRHYGQNGPESARFHNGAAWLPVRSTLEAQSIVDTFKDYLNATNKEYAKRVENKLRQKEELEQADLKKELAEEKRRQQILSSIKL